MKKIFLMGRSEAGKTSLTQALKGEKLHYVKTQYTNTDDDTIDSPGEYAESKHFSVGLACFSFEAGVLAMRPKVLVLDEPTAGLDPKGRDEILDQIAYLHEKADMTVILVSHSMEDIAKYVDRIIVMNKGSVMFNDVPKKVFAHYKELESVGLAAPQVTYIMHALKEKGMDVPTDATTIEEAADGIMKALKKERAAK